MAVPPERKRYASTFAYSMTLVAAGALGFLTLTQSGERPDFLKRMIERGLVTPTISCR
jgi:hypothetical protein